MTGFRCFLEEQEKIGNVIHVDNPVKTKYEVSAILQEFNAGPILFFENIVGNNHKIVGGVAGTRQRILSALSVEEKNLYQKLKKATENPVKCTVENGPVKEVTTTDESLMNIPVLTHFQGDPGPYITSGIVYARVKKFENISFHRLLIHDERKMTTRIVPRQLFRLLQLARDEGMEKIDISISIGVHPAVLLAAALPTPFGVSEFDVANNLLEGALKLTKCKNIDALAPAESELVLECQLFTNETDVEGPFVDLSGTFDVERSQPVVNLVGVMHRRDFIYQALLPSGSEHLLLMGMPREVRIWEYAQNVVPTIRGVNMTTGGMGWLHCVVSFDKFREGDPKNLLMAIFSAHPSLKHAVVVDSDIDPFDMEQVEWAIATRFRGDEDLFIVPNVRVSSLDPASDQVKELGCKVGIDATKPLFKDQDSFKRAEIPLSDNVKRILKKLGV